jgi:hypothetical protein
MLTGGNASGFTVDGATMPNGTLNAGALRAETWSWRAYSAYVFQCIAYLPESHGPKSMGRVPSADTSFRSLLGLSVAATTTSFSSVDMLFAATSAAANVISLGHGTLAAESVLVPKTQEEPKSSPNKLERKGRPVLFSPHFLDY